MLKCGLLGEKLGHSYSPQIHAYLDSYEYRLYEKKPEEVESFLKDGDWDALNVTIPYKKLAASMCDEVSEIVKTLASANTLVKKDGKIYGYNTDYFGFMSMVQKSGIELEGKKALVLGSGGASVTACAVLKKLGAKPVVISRSGQSNYTNLYIHSDAGIIVNATPVGMYPANGRSAVDLDAFPCCTGVMDLIYNPLRTELIIQAEERGIPCMSGLHMLVAQAKRSSELFTGSVIPDSVIEDIRRKIELEQQNIVLIGMPGCGKSEISRSLAQALGRQAFDADEMIEERAGMSIPEIFERDGEEGFRALESQALSDLGKLSGAVISTGGGCVTVDKNYRYLHQNGVIVWLQRDLSRLPKDGRPISQKSDLAELYAKRENMYSSFSDFAADNNGTVSQTVNSIISAINKRV